MNTSIGNAELRLLSYLSEHGPMSVRDAWHGFGTELGYVRTTILQMMERLRRKGLLAREKTGGAFVYRVTTAPGSAESGAVAAFVRQALGGSISPFVQYLSEAHELREEDLQELERLVAELRGRK